MTATSVYDFETTRGYAVVSFNPALGDCRWGDIENVGNEIRQHLTEFGRPVFMLDLSRLDFIGSSVVALIVKLWKNSQENDGGMVVVNSSTTIAEVLNIAGLSRLWTIVDTQDEAKAILARPPYHRPSPRSVYLMALTGWIAAAAALSLVFCTQKGIGNLEPSVARIIVLVCSSVAALCGALTVVKFVARGWKILGVLLVFIAGSLAVFPFLP